MSCALIYSRVKRILIALVFSGSPIVVLCIAHSGARVSQGSLVWRRRRDERWNRRHFSS